MYAASLNACGRIVSEMDKLWGLWLSCMKVK
jgi:hypothetical protein